MISIIVAIGKNNVIGKDNDLPWHYPEDLTYFKETTLNHAVLMGSKTFLSILTRLKKPLPKRRNIVVSRTLNYQHQDVEVIRDLETFLKTPHDEEIFIIGGKQIYEVALNYADRLYITHINKDYDGNVFFPKIDYDKYQLISRRDVNELSFCIYERK